MTYGEFADWCACANSLKDKWFCLVASDPANIMQN
jgi:hypothetical protein